jgi:hypothetical protein
MASLIYAEASPGPSSGTDFVLQQLLGPVQFGWDASNNFARTLNGLAILRPDGRYIARDEEQQGLLDVTPLILTGVPPYVLRLPVSSVDAGDLIVVSDCPFSVLYVLETYEEFPGRIRGLDPLCGTIVDYSQPVNPFFNFFVKVVSLYDLFDAWQDEGFEQ